MLENWQPKEKNIIQAENSSYRSAGDFKWILPNLNLMIVLNGYSHGFSTYKQNYGQIYRISFTFHIAR